MAAISRAFTTKRVKASIDLASAARSRQSTDKPTATVQRSKTTKAEPTTAPARHQISAPIELLHTTNMLSYNAPDIRPRTNSSSSDASTKSTDDDLDSPTTAASSPPTSPEVSPLERCASPEPNHLSCYFTPPGQAIRPAGAPQAPAIPQRAASHTKKASFEANRARQRSASTLSKDSDRSLSTKASFSFSRSSSTSTSASSVAPSSAAAPLPKPAPVPAVPAAQMYQQKQKQEKAEAAPHPFGRELAQVTEIAEEYGVKDQLTDEDERTMKAQRLRKFTADDYLGEIHDIFASFFPDSRSHPEPETAMWI